MRKRYFCPGHKESTPSAVVYADRYYSFCCGKSGPITELGLAPGERIETEYVEDLETSLSAIRGLPKRPIRGFELPYNERGYFLLWPDSTYYKFRRLGDDTPGGKYRGPSGHKKPWFEVRKAGYNTLSIVEGEFNALSLGVLDLAMDIVSPGGAGDFHSRTAEKYLMTCNNYTRVNVVVDDDPAGAQAAIEATSRLKAQGLCDVRIFLVKEDFNDIHSRDGVEALRRVVTDMGLLVRV